VAKAVVDKETIMAFLYDDGAPKAKTEPLSELLKGSKNTISNREIIEKSVQFANENATAREVADIFKKNALCCDVFITRNGGSNEPVLAWITKSDLVDSI
jgi:hypothetical protein